MTEQLKFIPPVNHYYLKTWQQIEMTSPNVPPEKEDIIYTADELIKKIYYNRASNIHFIENL